MAAKKYLQIDNTNGRTQEKAATVVSAGAGNDGDVVALDATGRIDVSVLPVGVGPDVSIVPSFENLSAGDYINIFDDAGTVKARLADQSNSRPAHGFVKANVTSPANATVYFEGPNSDRSGLTKGKRYFLDTAGGVVSEATVPTTGLLQFVGIAVSTTTINTDIADEIERA